MGAMKNLVTDTDREHMLYLCNSISQARDEYRAEALTAQRDAAEYMARLQKAEAENERLREINAEMLKALRFIESGISVASTPEDTAAKFRSAARAAITKAEDHQ